MEIKPRGDVGEYCPAISALRAQQGGAYRVELCAALPEGGTTPSYGEICTARRLLDIKLNVIIRPRGGDFLYTPIEQEVMLHDIEQGKRNRKIGRASCRERV